MKRIIFLLTFFFFAVFAAPAADGGPVADLNHEIDARAKMSSSLYSFVLNEMQTYYNRADFADPGRDTGWYRVDDFLVWLKNHEKSLLEQKFRIGQDDYTLAEALRGKEEYFMQTVWTFLGIKYLQYKAQSPNRDVFSFYYCQGDGCAVARQSCIIRLGLDNKTPALLINGGLHEAAHVLYGCSEERTLSEAAAVRAQNLWALPVPAASDADPRMGVRDARVLFKAKPNPRYFAQEYAFFFLAPLLQDEAFHILHHDGEVQSFCRFLSERLMPEWGPVITSYDGALEASLPKWLGKRQAAAALENARAGKLLTLGQFSKEEILKFYKFYHQAVSGRSDATAREQAYLLEKERELQEPFYWAYLSFDGRVTLQFSQTPALEEVLKQYFPSNALTAQVKEFFERARDQQNRFDGRCSTMEFMYKINDILNDLAGAQSAAKVPAGYI